MTTQQTVRVYSKPNCMQCRLTEKWLTDRKVPFIHDSAEDEGVIAAAHELGISAAPIVVVQTPDPETPGGFSDQAWGGFQPTLLEQHIDTKEFAA
jgi:glutaredoxin-like protein NrdH